MKKKTAILISILMVVMFTTCQAVSYSLPEKMANQLAIGSGLKGNFRVEIKGDRFRTDFLDAISDADFAIRGISSGEDLHYYVCQLKKEESGKEQQKAISELYRQAGVYYFRSDMVQGKTLAFPSFSQMLDAVFSVKGENSSASSFVSRIIALPDDEKKEKWEPVLSRYQNELEIWLADFTVKADTVKLESGFSALDFAYEIPAKDVIDKILAVTEELTKDPEASLLFDTVMTPEEKSLYFNANLLYFYKDALNSVILNEPVRMKKRVSAMGELLSFEIDLPMDEKNTGFQSVQISMLDQKTVYTIRKHGALIVIAIPEISLFRQPAYDNQSVWLTYINTDNAGKDNNSFAIRADIKKTNAVYDAKEENHEEYEYIINIQKDLNYTPDDLIPLIPEFDPISVHVNLHYSSGYAQNKATTLQINATVSTISSVSTDDKNDEKGSGNNNSSEKIETAIPDNYSQLVLNGEIKTAQPWIFMPFDIENATETGTKTDKVILPYIEDWISNAKVMIMHNTDDNDIKTETDENKTESESNPLQSEKTDNNDGIHEESEAVPLDDSGEE